MIELLISGINLVNLSILFIWIFITSLGVPGGVVAMVSSGALANSFIELIPVILITVSAAILGDITAYELARKFSLRLSKKLIKFKFFKNNEIKSRDLLKKHEFSFVFFTRFALIGLCAVVSYISGFERLNRKKFYMAVISGEIIYASLYPIIGFIFKETWNDLVNIIQDILIIVVLIVVAGFLFIITKRKDTTKNSSR